MTQDYHDQYEWESRNPAFQAALKSRNYKHIENEFPDGTNLEEMVLDKTCEGSWIHPTCPWVNPCRDCQRYEIHTGQYVVAIDGACYGNGTPDARAAAAVYFGFNNQYNFLGLLDYEPQPTSQKAELTAAIKALEIVKRIRTEDEDLDGMKSIVIKTDSVYLVDAMTEHIYKWRHNGYRNAQDQRIKNSKHFKYLDELVDEFQSEEKIDVFFWHVPRRYNAVADSMAKFALSAPFSRPKVYVVVPRLEDYDGFKEFYAPLLKLLQERATVAFVGTTTNLANLVEGPNTKFLLADDGCVDPQNYPDMTRFSSDVRGKGSRVAIGTLVPCLGVFTEINSFFAEVLKVTWQTASYTKDYPVLNRKNTCFNTEGLLEGKYIKALFVKGVPQKQLFYKMKHRREAMATCVRQGTGYFGYVGAVACEPIVARTLVAMLGLPPVYADEDDDGYDDYDEDEDENEKRHIRLLTSLTRIEKVHEEPSLVRSQIEF